MDTRNEGPERPTLAQALSTWAASAYAFAVAAKAPGMITDQSGLAKVWFRQGLRLQHEAVSLMEGVICGRWREAIPGLDFGVGPIVWSAYTGHDGLDPREILARGELLSAGARNVEAIGELVLEFRETDRARGAQRLADVVYTGPELYTFAEFVTAGPLLKSGESIRVESGPIPLDDPTMTPAEFGAYREQEEDAKERESWSAEEDTAWIDDTDSLPTVPEGFDAFDPAAALEGRGEAVADDTTHEEDTDR